MRMREDENITKNVERVKANVSAIVVSNFFRTLLHIYAIRVSTIQEGRCETNHKITLDALMEIDRF